MKEEEFVLIPVPKSMARQVYRLLGGTEQFEQEADPAMVRLAYEESSAQMKAVLDLLAAHPGEWLTIEEIRDALGMELHQLPGVLSTFPRRWRGRYGQAGPLPFEVEGKGSLRRYRVGSDVAGLLTAASET